MTRLLSILTIILAIILFPPAALALVSNNAIPGDATYPIKRSLEDVIYAAASLNPTTKAWFAAARSDRRFKEFITLVAQGKSVSRTLNELVTQTETAASDIKKIDDPIKRQDLVNQLSESIDKYDQKLGEVSHSTVIITPQPTVTARPTLTPLPSEVSKPTFTPIPTQVPTITQPPINPQEIDEAKKKLEEIKKKLEEEMRKHQEDREIDHKKDSDKEKKEEHQDKKEIRTQ